MESTESGTVSVKLIIEFDMTDPDAKSKFERMYRADIAWNAVGHASAMMRSALKHIDNEELFRDRMIEIQHVLMNATDTLDE